VQVGFAFFAETKTKEKPWIRAEGSTFVGKILLMAVDTRRKLTETVLNNSIESRRG
jgi:hypothetical protein